MKLVTKSIEKTVSMLLSLMIIIVFTRIPASVQAAEVCTDILTVEDTGATRTNYVNWTAQSGEDHPRIASASVYSGNSAKGNGGIQLRSKSQSGVVTTGTGGKLRRITVAWIDTYQNDDKYLAVYGSNTAYTSAADLYGDARGTLLDTLVYNDAAYSDEDGVYYSEMEITDDYRYFGIRSKSGALYLSSVSVDWEIFDVNREWNWAEDYSSATCTFTDESGSHTETATITSEVTKQPSYLAEGVLTYTATVIYNGVTYRDVQTEPIEKPVFGGSVSYINENGELTDSPDGTVLLTGNEGSLSGGWYTFAADTSVDNLTFSGDCKLVLCDGVTVTSKDHFNVEGSLTVYGQTDSSGTLAGIASDNNDIIGGSGSLTINGGTYRWVGTSGYGCVSLRAGHLTVNGGSFTNCNLNAGSSVTVNGGTVNNDENTRINCPNGTVTVSGGDIFLKSDGSAVDCKSFVYNGGSFKAERGLDGFVYSRAKSVTLSWTKESDSIYVGQYGCWVQEDGNTMRFDGVNMSLQKNFVDQDGNKYPAGTYFSDALRYKTLRPDVDRWNALQQEINNSESGKVIQLTSDCFASPNDSALVVPNEKELLTIDLNGYTIDRGLAESDAVAGGNVITNHATELHIIDTSAKKTGRITGGNNTEDGGGIISDVDTLYLENVTVSGNKSAGNGGGIWAEYYVEMKNCEVTDNVAGGNGGGLYWPNNNNRNKLVVSGSVRVTGNTNSDGSANNVYLPGSQVFISVTDTLSNDTLIGVSTTVPEKTITSGLSGRGSTDNFRSDSESWLIGVTSSGEAKLQKPYVIHFDANGGSGETEDIVTLDSSVTMPECTFTAPEDKRFKAWSDGSGHDGINEDEEVGLTPGVYEYTISAVWADVYTITVTDTTGGTLRTNKLKAIEGERVRLTPTPDEGYRINQIYVQYSFNQSVNVVNNSYFLMPAANVTVKAHWFKEHTITLSNWNCTAQTNLDKAFKGDTITVTVTPDDGCVLNSIDAYYYGEYHTLSGSTFTMPDDDVIVYVNCLVGTPYIDEDGEEKLAPAYTFGFPSNINNLIDHWYAVDEEIAFDHDVEVHGDVRLILCDGATLSFTQKEDDSDCGRFVFKGNSSLTIYGQEEGTGKFTCGDNVGYMSIYSEPKDDYDHGVLTMNGGVLEAKTFGQIIVDEVNINRGTVKNFCVYARGDLTVNGGTIEVDEKYNDNFYTLLESGYGDVIINGGTIDLDVYSTGIRADNDVRITGGDLYLRSEGTYDAGISAENNVTITGGKVVIPETEARGIYVSSESGEISLSWTSLSDCYEISSFKRWSQEGNSVVDSNVIINRYFSCDDDGSKYAVAPGVISDNSIWGCTLTPKCFAWHSLTLSGDIGVNFYLDVPASEAANAAVDFSYTVDGKRKTSTICLTDAELTDNGYRATCYVNAPEMTDDITAVLSFGEDEFEADHFSVKTYADTILSDEYKTVYLETEGNTEEMYNKLAALVTAMLNYGGAAQTQFADQHPNDACGMANDGLAAPAPLTQEELTAIDLPRPDKESINTQLSETGLAYYGYTMLLNSKTTLRFYFVKETPDTDISGIHLSIGTGAYTVTCNAKNYNDRYAYVEAEGIPAYDLNKAYTLTVNGKNLGSYSALTYVKDVLTDETADETLAGTVTALYRYHEAAATYFNDQQD